MPTANVALILWHGGWHERTSPSSLATHRRIEVALGLGAVNSVQEAEYVADQQLAILGETRSQIEAKIEPQAPDMSDMPYFGIRVADTATLPSDVALTMTSERLLSMTVSEDNEGKPIFQPEWRDIIYEGQMAFAQWLKAMANGTVGGTAKPATPLAQVSTPGPTCCPPPVPAPSS